MERSKTGARIVLTVCGLSFVAGFISAKRLASNVQSNSNRVYGVKEPLAIINRSASTATDFQGILQRVTSMDSAQLMARVEQGLKNPFPSESELLLNRLLLEELAQREPATCVKLLNEAAALGYAQQLAAAYRLWAAREPQNALASLVDMRDDRVFDACAGAAVEGLIASVGAKSAMYLLTTQGRRELATAQLTQLLKIPLLQIAREKPRDALKQIDDGFGDSPALQHSLRAEVLKAWAKEDATSLADWGIANVDKSAIREQLRTILSQGKIDCLAPGVLELASATFADSEGAGFRKEYGLALGKKDIEAALLWSQSIANPYERNFLSQKIVCDWAKRNPDEVLQRLVTQTDISPSVEILTAYMHGKFPGDVHAAFDWVKDAPGAIRNVALEATVERAVETDKETAFTAILDNYTDQDLHHAVTTFINIVARSGGIREEEQKSLVKQVVQTTAANRAIVLNALKEKGVTLGMP